MERSVVFLPDYYWRDYTGIIPSDAVKGGYDITHKSTYIGQAFFNDHGLLPGTIRSGCHSNLLTSVNNCLMIAEKHIKILCSGQPTRMKWINTSQEKIVDLTGHHFVIGGYNNSEDILYIGRTLYYECRMIVGNVCISKHFTHGLAIPDEKNDKQVLLPTFEILTYEI